MRQCCAWCRCRSVQMTAGTASALPSGFIDAPVAAIASPTAVESLPGGRVVVLEQDSGRVRLIDSVTGALLPTAALQLGVCGGGERGLLGFTHDPTFATSGRVYVFYTRPSSGAPGGCVNRVSAFVMSGNTIDPASEQVLLDNISSVNGNHNAGDLDVGADGFLYVSTGDAGGDPRDDSGSGGSNDAAQDLSLLNGKILRIDRFTGAPAPGNPLDGRRHVRDEGQHAVDTDHHLPGDLRLGSAQPVPLRVRSEQRLDPVLRQRRRPERSRGDRRRSSRRRLRLEQSRGSVPPWTESALRGAAARCHRPDHRLRPRSGDLHHRRGVRAAWRLATGLRRGLPVRRRRVRSGVAALP